ncbi:hypothetical protein PENSPDRAFT_732200 [Peniophora sp. CONT]|nr:hypothetical protein PENSPDRAFT_732200 [Peniophora sp. CONT]
MEYLSVSVPGFVDDLAGARMLITFTGYSITGLAQLVSTTLIAYRAWVHWREVRESIYRSVSRPSLAALAIIIESGVAYLALLVWYGSISWWGNPYSAVVYTCRFYSVPLIAMYPTLVIIVVTSHRSVLERSIGVHSAGQHSLSWFRISFARSLGRTSVAIPQDDEWLRSGVEDTMVLEKPRHVLLR